MDLALEEARQAARQGEVPIGAVAVHRGQLVGRGYNRSISLSDATAHAEVLALRGAGRTLGNYRLNGVHLYVTLEPCAMCAGALVWSRVERLVFGASDEKAGAAGSRIDVLQPGLFNHTVQVQGGVRAEESRRLLQDFFALRRR